VRSKSYWWFVPLSLATVCPDFVQRLVTVIEEHVFLRTKQQLKLTFHNLHIPQLYREKNACKNSTYVVSQHHVKAQVVQILVLLLCFVFLAFISSGIEMALLQ